MNEKDSNFEKPENAAEQPIPEEESSSGANSDDIGGELGDALELAREEIAELNDKLLRAHAEMDNIRKRAQREIEETKKYGIEKFVTELLDVIDNLERALESKKGSEEAIREGVKLTLEQWHKLIQRFHMQRIDAVGKPFDPHHHEALSQVPSEEPAGTVVAQHEAGYLLHDRLIRPARVLVSSGPSPKEKDDEEKKD